MTDTQKYMQYTVNNTVQPIMQACLESASQGKDVRVAAMMYLKENHDLDIPPHAEAMLREIEHSQCCDFNFVEVRKCMTKPVIDRLSDKSKPAKEEILKLAMDGLSKLILKEAWICRLCSKENTCGTNQECEMCGLSRDALFISSQKVTEHAKRAIRGRTSSLRINTTNGILSKDNLLTKSDAASLNGVLRTDTEITQLIVSADGDAAVASLLEGLGCHPKLEWITISECHCAGKAATVLKDVIKNTKTLTGIAAIKNDFDDKAIAAIAEGIAENKSGKFAQLLVASNRIGDEGAKSIAEAVSWRAVGDELRLEIGDNPLSPNGLDLLLRSNVSLVFSGESGHSLALVPANQRELFIKHMEIAQGHHQPWHKVGSDEFERESRSPTRTTNYEDDQTDNDQPYLGKTVQSGGGRKPISMDKEVYINDTLNPFIWPIMKACREDLAKGKDVRIAAVKVLNASYGISISKDLETLMRNIEETNNVDLNFVAVRHCITKSAIENCANFEDLPRITLERLHSFIKRHDWKCRLCGNVNENADNRTCQLCGLPRSAFGLSSEQVTVHGKQAIRCGSSELRINTTNGVLSTNNLLKQSDGALLNEILRTDNKITQLIVSADGDDAVASLLDGLGDHSRLKWITISECGAAGKAAKVLRDVIKTTTTLEGIAANHNFFDDSAIADIAEGIAENLSGKFTELQVAGNNIMDNGAQFLLDAATSVAHTVANYSLRLEVANNPLSDDAMHVFLMANSIGVLGSVGGFVSAMLARDKDETQELLSLSMESIHNLDAMRRVTSQQEARFELALRAAAEKSNNGTFDEIKENEQLLRDMAFDEEKRLISLCEVCISRKYQVVKERWRFVKQMKTIDEKQKQYLPAGVEEDKKYIDLALAKAQWVQPGFFQLCDALAHIFNKAKNTQEICSTLGLNPDAFPLPLRNKALLLADSKEFPDIAETDIVHVQYGPSKERSRAEEKCNPTVQKWLADDRTFPPPKGQYCLTDIVRVTFSFGDPFVLALMANVLITNFEVTRMVNRLCGKNPSQPPNVNMNLRIDGFLCEVQLLLADILTIKKALHKFYKLLRATTPLELSRPVFDLNEIHPDFAYVSHSGAQTSQDAASVIQRYVRTEHRRFHAPLQQLTRV
eukprot:gnl/MRDRNA2_/MRDRNA2_85908_c0_seq1.p1 gnl/MRDRNA2_/MRDRNA2_85908_c0~~gnl/MRDRNA2_/MRDRNA2_85908_c0_seq1.p1  ORF type:complete len:1320 (+),score=231.68 gnl/MRDRNA2_/MRDRNA2_85908_c0_seq1:563-3961(+)